MLFKQLFQHRGIIEVVLCELLVELLEYLLVRAHSAHLDERLRIDFDGHNLPPVLVGCSGERDLRSRACLFGGGFTRDVVF